MIAKNKFEFISHSTHHHHPFLFLLFRILCYILTTSVVVDLFEYIDRLLGNARATTRRLSQMSDMQKLCSMMNETCFAE